MKQTKVYLYELVRIVRKLDPKQSVSHSFHDQLLMLQDRYNATDLLLLDDLIKTLTLLNLTNRKAEENQLLATQADFDNALHLMTDTANRLNKKKLHFVVELHKKFGFEPFTHFNAAMNLQRSLSVVKRLIKTLVYHNLVVITSRKAGTGEMAFRVNPHIKPQKKQQLSCFDEAMEQWEDFKGWIDTQNRT